MSEELLRIIIPAIVVLLIIWLILRIKYGIRATIKNEIYNNFPSIKDTINNFEKRIDFLKAEVDSLERKISDILNKAQK